MRADWPGAPPYDYYDCIPGDGSRSGRDLDKVQAAGLTPLEMEHGAMAFREAELILVCRKLYRHDIVPGNFTDSAVAESYGGVDFHRQYIAEVVHALQRI